MRVVVQGRGGRLRRGGPARVLWAAAESTVTLGVVLLLLVVHQVWWTNRQAAAAAGRRVAALEEAWRTGAGAEARAGAAGEPVASPGPAGASPSPSEAAGAGGAADRPRDGAAYGVLRIPRLGVAVPVARGVDKRSVLDKGYAGHYPGTAEPGAQGNFALAGHRNTHGEPFRYLNRLRPGDELVVEVGGRRYAYTVDRVLPETAPRDTGVIAPVPRSAVRPAYGYTEPGAYITLTTCTPEYSSRYRLVVWGVLAGNRSGGRGVVGTAG
ncbi:MULTISPECIES: class E sortase [Streptomyces]|uniref:class E sortase n=1 Tax=Streptomyces TaxID=1883 RepID=UPI0016793CE5|nr:MULTISPECIES: class E sortase [Streptomyces]MBD3579640.1 class E sortase [Streptomyces sp. KD18]